jgi:hypothetical protein
MIRNTIFVLMYHRYKLSDLIKKTNFSKPDISPKIRENITLEVSEIWISETTNSVLH